MASDFLSALGIMKPIQGSYAVGQQVQQDQAQLAQRRAAAQLQGIQAQALQAKAQQDEAYQQDVMSYLAKPTTDGAVALMLKHPDKAATYKQAWDQKDAAQQTSDLGQLGTVDSYLTNNKINEAADFMQRHVDAEKKAGIDTADDEKMIASLRSGDPAAVKAVQGAIKAHLAAVVPEKFPDTLKVAGGDQSGKTHVVTAGGALVDDAGKELYRAEDKPEYRSVSPGEQIVQVNGAPTDARTQGGWTPRQRNGGDNPDAAVDNKITGVSQALGVDPDAPISSLSPLQIAKALAFGEGGAGSLADRNNNPTNIRNADGSYKKFANPDAAYNAAASMVARKLKNGQNTVRTLIEGLPVGGGARVVAQGAPKPGYQMLTPQEVQQIPGLDPNTVYQRSPDGQVTAVGGQSKSQLKAWPVPALQARTSNNATLTNITGAIDLLDDKNQTAAAKKARAAIGFGTGALGDRFTQMNDPEGTDARARIGQIGGLIIKDTSGAAVSLSEDARLAKWVPLVTDSPKVALAKLRNLKREISQKNQSMDETYSQDQGYRPFHQQDAPVRITTPAQAQALPSGTLFITPDGRTMRKR